jgi:hypothetical protein
MLRSLLTSKVFLFVGFSLDDDYVTDQLRGIEDMFQGTAANRVIILFTSVRT